MRSNSGALITYAQEDLSEDDVIAILEVDRIDDSNAVLTLGSDESALFAAVGDVEDLIGGLAGLKLSEDVLEGLGINVSLEERKTLGKLVYMW